LIGRLVSFGSDPLCVYALHCVNDRRAGRGGRGDAGGRGRLCGQQVQPLVRLVCWAGLRGPIDLSIVRVRRSPTTTTLHTHTYIYIYKHRFNKSLGISGKVGTVMMAITGSFFLIAEKVRVIIHICVCVVHIRVCGCGCLDTAGPDPNHPLLSLMFRRCGGGIVPSCPLRIHTMPSLSYQIPYTPIDRRWWTRSGTRTRTGSRRWRARRRRRRRRHWPRNCTFGRGTCTVRGVDGWIDRSIDLGFR
jgi:hypothetical protein